MQSSAADKILSEIKRLKEENALLKQGEPIAIIGMACRFPGADTIDQFWDLLVNGESAITDIPVNREDLLSYYQDQPQLKIKGGFLNDISQFDASFFNISPLEAESTDPQHRILLEVTYHALEDAGLDVKALSGSQTGVFVGITNGEYFYKNIQQEGETSINSYSAIGGTLSAAACRLSYYLGLEGPSMIVDTACSSSLVAVDMACKSLRDNSCSTAIVGGVNLMISPGLFVSLSKLNALSPDGFCKTFDDDANGYVRGEGCGVVILKKLSEALRDGDRILSVIKSTAVNQDGKSNGFTAPNEKAQEKVIQAALVKAAINPLDISYVETHGTGTKLGDPIELNALSEAYKRKNIKSTDQPLYVGSVKTNIGHLESAAGIAGLLKVILALQHKKIPAHLNFHTPNTFISWDNMHIHVPRQTIEWKSDSKKRLAALSSFGFTGTNVHMIIEEGQAYQPSLKQVDVQLLTLSAKSKEVLIDLGKTYCNYLQENRNVSLGDLCYTVNTGRAHYKERLALLVTSVEDTIASLHWHLNRLSLGNIGSQEAFDITFVNSDYALPLKKIAEQYVNGEDINWKMVYQNQYYKKIALPVYPFKSQSYWFGKKQHPESSFKNNVYHIEWKEQDLVAADYIISPSEIMKSVSEKSNEKLKIGEVEKYKKALLELEEISVDYILEAFNLLGFKWEENRIFNEETLFTELKIKPIYDKFFSRLLEILSEKSFIKREESNWKIACLPLFSNANQRVERALQQYPEAGAEIELLSICGQNVASILIGKQDPISILFPKGNFSLLTNIYQQSPAAQWMNTALQTAVEKVIERLPLGRKIRILEIGAGTGSTTSYLLSILPTDQTEYIFSDVSTIFIERAKKKFSEYSFVDYKLLDVEKDGKTQGFEPGYFDIIIASNVLHATENIQHSIRNVQTLLSAGGIVLLLEGTEKQRWADLIFGLTDGWWRYKDKEVRGNYPLLAATKWKELLELENYSSVERYAMADYSNDTIFHQTFFIAQNEGKHKESENWLLFVDENIETEKLIQILSDKGKHATIVHKGNEFARLSTSRFSLHPYSLSHFQQLFQDLKQYGTPSFSKIVYGWGANLKEGIENCNSICLGLVNILKIIQNEAVLAKTKLWVVTKGVHSVDRPVQYDGLLQSSLWGMGKSIFLEYPELWGGMVDLGESDVTQKMKQFVKEVENGGIEDHVYISEKRYVPRIKKQELNKTKPLSFNKDAWYLISGGLGFLGLESAKWLATQGVKNIILTTRNDFPKEQDWDTLDNNHIYYETAFTLLGLKRKQVNIKVCKADITNKKEVEHLLTKYKNIKGIIHAAGKSGYKTIPELEEDELREMLAPKMKGAWILHQLTEQKKLDFFIMLSSGSSVWGSKGLAHYAAANHFLDALSHYRNEQGLNTLSINLGLIQGGGMVQNQHQQALLSTGLEELQIKDIFSALTYLLQIDSQQTTLAKVNWSDFKKIYELRRKRPLLEELKTEARVEPKREKAKGLLIVELEKLPLEKRKDYLIHFLQTEIVKVMGSKTVELPNIRKGFFEIGIDSLMAVEIKNRLEVGLTISLPSTLIFDYPTIEDVANYLIAESIALDFDQTTTNKQVSEEKEIKDFHIMNEAELAQLLANELNYKEQ